MIIKKLFKKTVSALLIAGVLITGISGEEIKADMNYTKLSDILNTVQSHVDGITVNSKVNLPNKVVTDDELFFEWDNEKRALPGKKYLFEWSYYNGVVFEGLKYIYDLTGSEKYYDYVKEYMQAMITDGALNEHAGYVSTHGLDCYKTASLLLDFVDFNSPDYTSNEFYKVATTLYADLTGSNADNYTEESIGGNYWHSWVNGKAPAYKVWLDGLYMAQPFLAEYAYYTKDTAQLDKITARFKWMSENMVEPGTGLYYHAANSADSVVDFHWTRAIGWYVMALADVMQYMEGENLETLKAILKDTIDALLKYQDDETGMWANLVDERVTDTNRLETSGTSMISYVMTKAVRNGWLEDNNSVYMTASIKAFAGMVRTKLTKDGLEDIYFKASASGKNNYEETKYYLTDEGKGLGPFIMAYAEMLAYYAANEEQAEKLMSTIKINVTSIPKPTATPIPPTVTPTPTPTPVTVSPTEIPDTEPTDAADADTDQSKPAKSSLPAIIIGTVAAVGALAVAGLALIVPSLSKKKK